MVAKLNRAQPVVATSDYDAFLAIHQNPMIRVKEVRRTGHRAEEQPGYSGKFHIVIPMQGSFVWREGSRERFSSAQNILFVAADRDYTLLHPLSGDRSLVLIPEPAHVEELLRVLGATDGGSMSTLCTPQTQLAARHLLWSYQNQPSGEEMDFLLGDMLASIANRQDPRLPASAAKARTVNRAKLYLQANLRNVISLEKIGREVGANPIYLSNLFRHLEGVSLHQYLVRLRLVEALHQLPDTDDLTTLAHDYCFSSHSHFSAAFRSAYRMAPATVRRVARNHLARRELEPSLARRGAQRPRPSA